MILALIAVKEKKVINGKYHADQESRQDQRKRNTESLIIIYTVHRKITKVRIVPTAYIEKMPQA